jgi:hypothetical protein
MAPLSSKRGNPVTTQLSSYQNLAPAPVPAPKLTTTRTYSKSYSRKTPDLAAVLPEHIKVANVLDMKIVSNVWSTQEKIACNIEGVSDYSAVSGISPIRIKWNRLPKGFDWVTIPTQEWFDKSDILGWYSEDKNTAAMLASSPYASKSISRVYDKIFITPIELRYIDPNIATKLQQLNYNGIVMLFGWVK